MSALTEGQLAKLRAHPHIQKTYLSVVGQVQLLSARVNDAAIGRGETSIDYDSNTTSADYFAVLTTDPDSDGRELCNGMTLLVGSYAGGDDYGRVRVKAVTGDEYTGTITVAWNADIDWHDNAYLTILHLYEIWPMFSRFTIDPEKFYKDYDITYTNQNTNIHPVAVTGSAWAGFLVDGTVTVDLYGALSYPMTASSELADLSYSWTVATAVAGASPSIDDSTASVTTVTFDTAGQYWVRLKLTDTNAGKSQYIYKPFVVHDADNLPVYPSTVNRVQDYNNGGVTLRFDTPEDSSDLYVGAPIILWSENYYSTTAESISYLNATRYAGRAHIDFFGYVISLSSSMSPLGIGMASVTAGTANAMLDNRLEYPVSLIAERSVTKGNINDWWKFHHAQLTVARALHHLWKWHSTLFDVCDVILPIDDDRIRAGCEEFTQGSLWERASAFANENGIFAKPCCNIYGELCVEIDIQMLDQDDREAITDTFTMATTDWQSELNIVFGEHNVAIANVSGGYWNGSTFTALLSKWGAVAANRGSKVLTADRIMTLSQSHINMLCGRLVARENRYLREIRFTMAGNWSSAIGIVPQQWIRLTLTGNEVGNKLGARISNVRMVPRTIDTTFNQGMGTSTTSIVIEPEAPGMAGVDGDYPIPEDVPPDPPPPPPPPPPIDDIVIPPSAANLVLWDRVNGCYFLNEGAAAWTEMNNGVDSTADYQGGYDPTSSGGGGRLPATLWRCQTGKIYASTDLGQNWYDRTPTEDPPNSWSDDPAPTVANVAFVVRTDNLYSAGANYFLARWQNGDSAWRGWILKTTDSGFTWEWEALGSTSVIHSGTDYFNTAPLTETDVDTFLGTLTVSNASGAIGEQDDDGALLTYHQVTHPGSLGFYLTFDFGAVLSGTGMQISIRNRGEIGTDLCGTADQYILGNDIRPVYISDDGISWTELTGKAYGGSTSWTWRDITSAPTSQSFRYVRLTGFVWCHMGEGGKMWIDSASVSNVSGVSGGSSNLCPIWMDTDSSDGSLLWITAWNQSTERLVLLKYATSDLSKISEVDLGACTSAQIYGMTRIAYPHAPAYKSGYIIVFGNCTPVGMSSNLWAAESKDGGATFTELRAALPDVGDYIGWLSAVASDEWNTAFDYVINDLDGKPHFAVNYGGYGPEQRTLLAGFGVGQTVHVDGVTGAPTGSFRVVTSEIAGATMVLSQAYVWFSDDDWHDITENLPVDGGVKSIVYLPES